MFYIENWDKMIKNVFGNLASIYITSKNTAGIKQMH